MNLETVSEQLLYEVGDPAAYYTPDVVADFTTPTFTEAGPDVVRCVGAKGQPATRQLQGEHRVPRRLDGGRHAGDPRPERGGEGPQERRRSCSTG